jgi:DNA-binding XRE family transcriptional regulator
MTPKAINPMQDSQLKKQYQPPKKISSEHLELMTKIGLKLQELRKKKNLSSSAFSDKVGLSRNAYHTMENGQVYYNISALWKVLDYHQITAKKFFKGL